MIIITALLFLYLYLFNVNVITGIILVGLMGVAYVVRGQKAYFKRFENSLAND